MDKRSPTPQQKRHPIQVVARRTGLSLDVLRVWEKRYAVVEPGRTPTGRRLYSDADIERLRLLREATSRGRRIGEVSALAPGALVDLIEEDRRAEKASPPKVPDKTRSQEAARLLGECLEAARSLDAARLRATLRQALLSLELGELIEDLVAPLLREIGEMWADHQLSPYHEHLASTLIRQTLGQMLAETRPEEAAPLIVATTPAGQRHEIGAVLAALAALAEGWRVVYLGPDLPAEDIARAAEETSASAIALSIVYNEGDPKIDKELKLLRDSLPEAFVIFVGGAAASAYGPMLKRIGAELLSDTRALRSALVELREKLEQKRR
jgi:DNA-binding transcriptional MerR regulator/methylmalonyl-CoA mutase cobalamin-binding subunit